MTVNDVMFINSVSSADVTWWPVFVCRGPGYQLIIYAMWTTHTGTSWYWYIKCPDLTDFLSKSLFWWCLFVYEFFVLACSIVFISFNKVSSSFALKIVSVFFIISNLIFRPKNDSYIISVSFFTKSKSWQKYPFLV